MARQEPIVRERVSASTFPHATTGTRSTDLLATDHASTAQMRNSPRPVNARKKHQVAVRATYAIHTGLGYGRLDVEDEDHDKDDEATDGVDKSGVQCCKLIRGGGRVGGDRGEGANRSGLGYEHSSGSDGEQQ